MGWPAIVMNIDAAHFDNVRYFRHVRVNQVDVYEPDSDGDHFVQIDAIWDEFLQQVNDREEGASASKKSKKRKRDDDVDDTADREKATTLEKALQMYLQETFGFTVKEEQRFVTLFKNAYWRGLARQYCAYVFGRQEFTVSHWAAAAGQHLDRVRTASVPSTFVENC